MLNLRQLLVFSVFMFVATSAFAEITITSISGASRKDVNGTSTSYAWGGAVGSECSSGDTCDSCGGGIDTPCNENRINDNGGDLTIKFRTTEAGDAFVVDSDGNQVTEFNSDTASENETIELSADWSDLCANSDFGGGAADCDTVNFQEAFRVGVDTDSDGSLDESVQVTVVVASAFDSDGSGTKATVESSDSYGIDDYEIFPGDEKVYLLNISALGNFPSYGESNADFAKIRVFWEEVADSANCGDGTTWDSITNLSSYFETDIEEIDGTDDVEPAEDYFTGFSNGQAYAFKLALVDEAGNISWYLDNNECSDDKHFVTPDEVFGILDPGSNCFITTASYGSPLEPKVQTFRRFRDEVLRNMPFGERVVRFYYRHSPQFAKVIQESPTLRVASQIFLWPLWLMIALILEFSFQAFVASSLIVIGTGFAYFYYLRSKEEDEEMHDFY